MFQKKWLSELTKSLLLPLDDLPPCIDKEMGVGGGLWSIQKVFFGTACMQKTTNQPHDDAAAVPCLHLLPFMGWASPTWPGTRWSRPSSPGGGFFLQAHVPLFRLSRGQKWIGLGRSLLILFSERVRWPLIVGHLLACVIIFRYVVNITVHFLTQSYIFV